jgi:malic enzyme
MILCTSAFGGQGRQHPWQVSLLSVQKDHIELSFQMDEFMEEFMAAMKDVFPHLLVQFEDFSTDNAFKYLDVFRNRYRCFNDDVRRDPI